ncbi:MAG: hypothetical protein P8P65_08385 [Planktotalea sp.]|jgi:hypothetical protein|uniref:hypothetical protein n=1 Tax=Planktotalea sp. TaxID=2029877 RepID=UPI0002F9183E|nr:hypothetical protein [Planktotalea sp.]MDG1076651.1 hypothetical protein [Planktotalea sp.]MDG1082649.1 hypothetical protein [Planktotalea sp.]HCW85273.1 hypothetical protein [Paracoccaceae bacterium]
MATKSTKNPTLNVVIVVQDGRLAYEAALFAASLRHSNPNFAGRLLLAEPLPGPLWPRDPRLPEGELRDLLIDLGGEFIQFESKAFGASYPYGNKIEAMAAMPKGENFVFFDTDTLIIGDLGDVPFDFDRPSASLRRENTWPQLELYGPGYAQTWKSLYDKFDLDFDSALDLHYPDEYWRRYPYYNAGFFFYKCPQQFGARFLHYAKDIRDDAPPELICQTLDPWLDQVALPLVIHSFGGGTNALPTGLLDGNISCHYRMLPLLYARENDHVVDTLEEVTAPNKIKKVLKGSNVIKRMIYQGRGRKVRDLFDQDNLPRKEQAIRNRIKKAGFWMR